MLDVGLHAACEFLGLKYRTVCYLEREAPAAAQLVTLKKNGAIDPAPIWSDLLTFDGSAWRGRVDCIVAGFPCQDLSIAGRRAGLNGKRSGLFFNILEIADACGASELFLENVAGIASATATVVDEAEGELEERAAARVLGELADRGWDAEWITLSASDVGANHGRARWFCYAWRIMAHPRHQSARSEQSERQSQCSNAPDDCAVSEAMDDTARHEWYRLDGEARRRGGVCKAGNELAQSESDRWSQGWSQSTGKQGGSDVAKHGSAMGDAQDDHRRSEQQSCGAGCGWSRSARASEHLADSECARRTTPRCGSAFDARREFEPGCCDLAHTSVEGLQGRELKRALHGDGCWTETHGSASELRRTPIFAPGPIDDRWAEIVTHRPELAPAIEPGVRMLVDGMAYVVDESRNHQLRQVGNGVVPLCAAAAFVQLIRRASLA